ncbi:MAG: transglutaminase [Candidatus Marinimicrobia bacterium]|jgi:transglutaminase-like putative cysteine protease|nr:transglutaminase [Candidatus Neomarinimicrobiota bacterium]MBT5996770.1 transglutaminase [Candidatus Neomarinimicrobiota bacterium]MBT6470457.1 transglutaminase [Candidatus Neomarinimicrobiota bacterium]MBT7270621.1 transglutaminase [Candidatus Neomarinimicrobiota bacterium]MBT7900343.1 transglutaminase [Candidatus Neomarinimicrobiota bacterium]|tara:strand:- start:658 stop:1404 length:747 start_codon:yes stop_codon:yes gene_type:complete
MKEYLAPTDIIDSDSDWVIAYADAVLQDVSDEPVAKAVRLYYAVRDGIWYDPYRAFFLPEHYKASNVLRSKRAFCVGKASLLCALGRAAGIPTRVGFADVRNHLATKQFIEFLGNDLFVYHAFVEFYLMEQWVRATPAFNVELCKKHHVAPLEFNGLKDSLFHSYDAKNNKFMEYLTYHGTFADIPVNAIMSSWEDAYGKKRVAGWIRQWKETNKLGGSDADDDYKEYFSGEDVLKTSDNDNTKNQLD